MDTYWKIAFRNKMKEKNITFKKLAQEIEMSLPGVKKIFQKDDISLERFNSICRILELDPSEVVKKGTRNGLKIKSISADADNYLAKDQRAFYLFWLLAVDGLDLNEATKILKLSPKETYNFLRKLDHFGLIQWEADDKIILPEQMPFVFERTSLAAMKFAKTQSTSLIEEVFSQSTDKDSYLTHRYLSVPRQGLSEISLRLKEVVDDVSRKYLYRGRKYAKDNGLMTTRILVCMAPGEAKFI